MNDTFATIWMVVSWINTVFDYMAAGIGFVAMCFTFSFLWLGLVFVIFMMIDVTINSGRRRVRNVIKEVGWRGDRKQP